MCIRHSRDGVLGSVDALSLCFPIFSGHLTIKPCILNGFGGPQTGRANLHMYLYVAFGPWAGTFKEGTRTFIPDTVYFIPDTAYLLLDT